MYIGLETNRPFAKELDYRPQPRVSFPRDCKCGELPDFLCVDSNSVAVAKCYRCAAQWMQEKGISA